MLDVQLLSFSQLQFKNIAELIAMRKKTETDLESETLKLDSPIDKSLHVHNVIYLKMNVGIIKEIIEQKENEISVDLLDFKIILN